MLCGNKYTDEEIKRGIGVLKAIKKRPNMSLREFKTSFINKKLVVKMVVFAIGKLRWISVQCFKHPSPHEKYRAKLFKGDVAMVMLLDSLRGRVPAGPKILYSSWTRGLCRKAEYLNDSVQRACR